MISASKPSKSGYIHLIIIKLPKSGHSYLIIILKKSEQAEKYSELIQ